VEGIVSERPILIVVVEAIEFEVKMRNVNIEPAVAINIRSIDPHACFVAAVFTGRQAGNQRDVFESAVALIDEQEIRPGIVSYGDVRPTIVVEFSQDSPHAFRFRLAYT